MSKLIETANEMLQCARSWEDDARLVGNVRAADFAKVCEAFIRQHESQPSAADAGAVDGEYRANISRGKNGRGNPKASVTHFWDDGFSTSRFICEAANIDIAERIANALNRPPPRPLSAEERERLSERMRHVFYGRDWRMTKLQEISDAFVNEIEKHCIITMRD